VECFETLTGETVDVDKSAIAEALKRFAAAELKQAIPVEALVKAHQLPVLGPVQEYRESLASIEQGSPDDCVGTLVGSGSSLKESHDRLLNIAKSLDETGLAVIRQARAAADQMWPQLQSRGQVEYATPAADIATWLAAEDCFDDMPKIKSATNQVEQAYQGLYQQAHSDRTAQFATAVDKIKGRNEWSQVPENMREAVLSPLVARCCSELELPPGSMVCRRCKATVGQMESDLAALGGLFAQVVAHIQKLTTPPEVKVQRVRIADFFNDAMDDEDQVKQAIARLQDHLLKLLDEGVKIVVE